MRLVTTFLLLFLFNSIAYAIYDNLGKLKADYFKFDESISQITVSGNVMISTDKFKVKSDRLYISTSTNAYYFEGNVEGDLEGYKVNSSKLVLYPDEGYIDVNEARANFSPENVGGTVYFYAKSLYDTPDLKYGEHGSFSTCKYDSKHYHIYANTFYYYPGKKLEAWHAIFNVTGMPILYSPYWFYKLGHQNPIMYYPVIGQENLRGWFVQTTWDWYINQEHSQMWYIDWYEKIGMGLGAKHTWKINKDSELMLKGFGLYDKNARFRTTNSDGSYKLDRKYYMSSSYKTEIAKDLNLNTSYYYQTYDRYSNDYRREKRRKTSYRIDHTPDKMKNYISHNQDNNYSLKKYDNTYSLNIGDSVNYVNYNETNKEYKYGSGNNESVSRLYKLGFKTYDVHHSLSHKREDKNNSLYYLSTEYKPSYSKSFSLKNSALSRYRLNLQPYFWEEQRQGAAFNKKLQHKYKADFYFNKNFFLQSANMEYYWIDDLDDDEYISDSSEKYYVRKYPEVKLNFKKIDIDHNNFNFFTINTTGLFAHYVEQKDLLNSDYTMDTTKYQAKTELSREQLLDELDTTIWYKTSFKQDFYGTGDAGFDRSDSSGFRSDLWEHFYYKCDFTKTYPDGNSNSPFYFDEITKRRAFERRQVFKIYNTSYKIPYAHKYSLLKKNAEHWNSFDWNFSWYHDFFRNYDSDVETKMIVMPIKETKAELSSAFDPNFKSKYGQKFWKKDLLISLDLKLQERLKLLQKYSIDLNESTKKNLSSATSKLEYTQPVSSDSFLHFMWQSDWNRTALRWNTSRYSVKYELDCIEYTYEYQRSNKDNDNHKFTFLVKAFPSDPIGISRSKVNGVEKTQMQGLDKNIERR